ncbi:Uncharacterised protein [Burkholderia pseudomallei]|uniref:hypothetical protein n=1 Tax=Burkholderia pseudomallei TaxID=28450 RepID=UPI000F213EC8|nr:hypothetical protein [Burkholderia pseudomallei]VBM56249.1 Uncharacterised protein [Burkholderia pseudomallei]
MKATLIADLIANVSEEVSVSHEAAANALNKTVQLLKAGLPFMLPVRVVTGHLPPDAVKYEDAEQPYVGVLLRWYANFISHPACEIDDLTDFIAMVRHTVADQIEHFLEQRQSNAPRSLRKRNQLECDLCDDVMIRWLSITNFVPLFELAFRWDIHCLSDDRPSVLDELGLTEELMFKLPESELVRLQLVERIEAENKRHLADLWKFLRDDPEGVRLEQLVFDTTKAYVVTHDETL